ncbi:MAG TPA: glutamine--fructose-6-phosphate transaminase (isomerizing) [Acidimicrobiales bacterium]|nr:glutamine--fructose-6-phosphate transaminase (isomerizing) [Acidimicrobiales bacterium]
MCGIIGVTGSSDSLSVLLAGLASLEYRGYDSAGIVIVDEEAGELWRIRAAERARSIEKLAARADGAPGGGGAAIGHTRWATHGAPTEENAHPHLDCSGRIAIVHNGIIENHRELAERLRASGHTMVSATDTEVFVHLVEEERATGCSLVEAVRRCLAVVRGDFAVAFVDLDDPEVIVAARRTSPLIIGWSDGVGILASDIAAALATTRELHQIGDDQVVELRRDGFSVISATGEAVEPLRLHVTWDVAAAQKGGYPDFMSKEIFEQPVAVGDTLLGRVSADGSTELEELALSDDELRAFERVMVVACGSSYHAGLVGRQAIETWARMPAETDIASEFRYRDSVLDERTLVVVVSQSGETIDTLHAMQEARRRGARVVALTNVVDSVMAREADGALYTRAGPEIGVASTKCHLAQLVMLQAFALHLARVRATLDDGARREIAGTLLGLPDAVAVALASSEQYAEVALRFKDVHDFYFLGRGAGLPVALEGALKLKELAYVRAEAYPAGEMKHGPISLIEPGAVVVVVATRHPLWEKVMANVEEMKARGATVVAVVDQGDSETAGHVDAVLEVPHVLELCSPVVDVLPLQRFAYEIARARGNDVDRPRNLAKVVTVE